jgi:TRAP-type C4-dicarboxylate transport system substrate-binding protein
MFGFSKKKFLVPVVIILIFSVLITAITGCNNSAEKETYTFNLAHFFPGTHPAETEFVQGWITAIDEATDGRVKITSYPGETLLKADAVYNGVVSGAADIGLSCFAYTRGRFPVLEAFELPGVLYNNSKSASMVAWEGIQELNPEEVQDTHLMMVIATGPGDLFSKEPIRNLADLQGKGIRATGLSAEALKLLGANPVAMPQSDAYDALSKGVVSGNVSPIEVLKGWKHAEVTDYITLTPFLYNTLFFVTFNKDKWESMPEDLRDTVTEVTDKFHEEVGIGLWDSQNEPALDYAVNEMGMEVITLSAEETELWMSKLDSILDRYKSDIADLTDTDVMDYVLGLADKYNDIYK